MSLCTIAARALIASLGYCLSSSLSLPDCFRAGIFLQQTSQSLPTHCPLVWSTSVAKGHRERRSRTAATSRCRCHWDCRSPFRRHRPPFQTPASSHIDTPELRQGPSPRAPSNCLRTTILLQRLALTHSSHACSAIDPKRCRERRSRTAAAPRRRHRHPCSAFRCHKPAISFKLPKNRENASDISAVLTMLVCVATACVPLPHACVLKQRYQTWICTCKTINECAESGVLSPLKAHG